MKSFEEFLAEAKNAPVASMRKVKGSLVALCKDYQQHIPMKEIAKVFTDNGLILIDDDFSEWGGMLTGADGKADIQVGINSPSDNETYPETNTYLHLSWHKMPSGKYEITAYTS